LKIFMCPESFAFSLESCTCELEGYMEEILTLGY